MRVHFSAMIGLLAGLVPVLVHAETNLDQGKSPAQVFAIDCATCHSGVRGLAKGKTAGSLTSFLREHYTTNAAQAAALAAYVLRSGGGAARAGEHMKASATESNTKRQARQHAKLEAAKSEGSKRRRAAKAENKRKDTDATNGTRAARQRRDARRHEGRSATAVRGRRKVQQTALPAPRAAASEPAAAVTPPEPAAPAPPKAAVATPEPAAAASERAAVAVEPAAVRSPETPSSQAAPVPAAPAEPGVRAPARRDDIPD